MTAPALLIDTLVLQAAVQPTFTVDSTTQEVAILNYGPGSIFSLNGLAAAFFFQPNDNIMLLEMGIILPYCFGSGISPFQCSLLWEDSGGLNPVVISRNIIPYANQPFSLAGSGANGLFVPHPGYKARIHMIVRNGDVSMINVPSNFPDLTVLGVGMYLKVQHQLPMVA